MTRGPALIFAALAVVTVGAPLPALTQTAANGPEAAKTQQADRAALPSDPEGLISFVMGALRAHDEEAIERLVNWDGVRLPRRRLTLYQIRTSFGRPIKQATVEDFPSDGLAEVEDRGKFRLNMPVTKRLRIVFDEASDDPETQPANVFLVGPKDGVFRIAVLNSVGPPVGK